VPAEFHVSVVQRAEMQPKRDTQRGLDPGLGWHGDAELEEGLTDFAVNVSDEPHPVWLTSALAEANTRLSAYPDSATAHAALARRHGRARHDVLATSGAAEAFTLLARARAWRHPVVV